MKTFRESKAAICISGPLCPRRVCVAISTNAGRDTLTDLSAGAGSRTRHRPTHNVGPLHQINRPSSGFDVIAVRCDAVPEMVKGSLTLPNRNYTH